MLALRNAGTCKLRDKRGTSHIIKKTLLLIQQRSPERDATYTISHRLLWIGADPIKNRRREQSRYARVISRMAGTPCTG